MDIDEPSEAIARSSARYSLAMHSFAALAYARVIILKSLTLQTLVRAITLCLPLRIIQSWQVSSQPMMTGGTRLRQRHQSLNQNMRSSAVRFENATHQDST